MKVSEAIKKLQEILDTTGDMEVVVLSDIDGQFIVDFDKSFEAIEVPNEDESGFETVCAMMDGFEGEHVPNKTDLKIIQ